MPEGYILFSVNDAIVLYSLLTSAIIPFIVSILKQNTWPNEVKFTLALLLSLVGGYLNLIISGSAITGISLIALFGLLFTASQAFYKYIFKPLGWDLWFNKPTTEVEAIAAEAGAKTELAVIDALEETSPEATPINDRLT